MRKHGCGLALCESLTEVEYGELVAYTRYEAHIVLDQEYRYIKLISYESYPMGKILFGICCGILTGLFRTIGASPEGVSYAIILSNLLVPLIEKVTIPRAFGVVKVKEAK